MTFSACQETQEQNFENERQRIESGEPLEDAESDQPAVKSTIHVADKEAASGLEGGKRRDPQPCDREGMRSRR